MPNSETQSQKLGVTSNSPQGFATLHHPSNIIPPIDGYSSAAAVALTPSPSHPHQPMFYSVAPTTTISTNLRNNEFRQQREPDTTMLSRTPILEAADTQQSSSSKNRQFSIKTASPQQQGATLGVSFRPTNDSFTGNSQGRLHPRQQRRRDAASSAANVESDDNNPNASASGPRYASGSVLKLPAPGASFPRHPGLRSDDESGGKPAETYKEKYEKKCAAKGKAPGSVWHAQWTILKCNVTRTTSKLRDAMVNPSLPAIVTLFAVVAVAIATVCAMIISETLFRTSMEDFATKAAQSISAATAMDVTFFLQHAVRTADSLQFTTMMADRMIPADEERDMMAVQPPLREIPENLWERYDVYDHLNGTQHMDMSTYRKFYFQQLAGLMRASNYRYQAVSAAFEDGAACTVNSDLYSSQKTAILWATDGFMRSYDNGTARNRLARFVTFDDTGHQVDRTGYYNNSYDPRTRAWYHDTPNDRFTKTWTNFTLTVYPTRPVISLTAPLWNSTSHIGKLSFSLELSALSKMLTRTKTIDGSKMFLIANNFVLGASVPAQNSVRKSSNKTAVNFTTIPSTSKENVTYFVDDVNFGDQIYAAIAVPRGYVLTEADLIRGCQIAEEEEGTILSTTKFCPHTIDSFGYEPLIHLRNKMGYMFDSSQLAGGKSQQNADCEGTLPLPSIIESLVATVKELKSEGDDFYAVSVPIVVSCSNNMDWVLVTLIPKDQITGVFSDVRNIVIGVTIGIIVVIVITIIIAARLTLRSLSDIAELMTAAAYLRDFDEDELALDDHNNTSGGSVGNSTQSGSSLEPGATNRTVARGSHPHDTDSDNPNDSSVHDAPQNNHPAATTSPFGPHKPLSCPKKAKKKAEKQRAERLAAIEKLRKKIDDRTESRWSEVRAIQRAYWAMSEELATLKAYIPEHLKHEIVAIHRRKLMSNGDQSSNEANNTSERTTSRGSSSANVTPVTDLLTSGAYRNHQRHLSQSLSHTNLHGGIVSSGLPLPDSTPVGPAVSSALLPEPRSISNLNLGAPTQKQIAAYNNRSINAVKVTSTMNTPIHHAVFGEIGAFEDPTSASQNQFLPPTQRQQTQPLVQNAINTSQKRRQGLADAASGAAFCDEDREMSMISSTLLNPSSTVGTAAGVCNNETSATSAHPDLSASVGGAGVASGEGNVVAVLRRLSSGGIGSVDGGGGGGGGKHSKIRDPSSAGTEASIGMGMGMATVSNGRNVNGKISSAPHVTHHTVLEGNLLGGGAKLLKAPINNEQHQQQRILGLPPANDTPLGRQGTGVSPSTDSLRASPLGNSFQIGPETDQIVTVVTPAKLIPIHSDSKTATQQQQLPSYALVPKNRKDTLDSINGDYNNERSILAIPMPYQIHSNGKWSLPGSVREGGIGYLGGGKRREVADGQNTFFGGSLDNFSALAAKAVKVRSSDQPPVFFVDSSLVDREITVVHMNIIHFHQYARRRHPMTISSEYAEFITYIKAEVKRFGGVLESFFGDKFWISFNATSKCDHHAIAASYFAYHVTTVINNSALKYLADLAATPANATKADLPAGDPRFSVCRYGANCGVATGRAFVGPLGNKEIKRHSIISNALSEAIALERLSLRYPGVNAMIGGDMIPAIEGYCQYLLVDATLLPGSQGKRRRVACLKGPMLAPSTDPNVVRRWLIRRKATVMSTMVSTQQQLLQQRQNDRQASAVAANAIPPQPRFSLSGPSMASVGSTSSTSPGGADAPKESKGLSTNFTIYAYDIEEVNSSHAGSDDQGKSSDSNPSTSGSGHPVQRGVGTFSVNGNRKDKLSVNKNPTKKGGASLTEIPSAGTALTVVPALISVPTVNKYKTLNESFNAVLEGQNMVAQQLLYTVATEIQEPDIASAETDSEFVERKAIMEFMAQLVQAFLTNGIEGRSYKSSLGDRYMPFSHVLAVSSNLRIEF